jgi:predicted TIM-barrel fold metal-dependent hydrolase
MFTCSRRDWIAGVLGAAGTLQAARSKGIIIDTHIHLWDPERFPYHKNAVYRPPAQTVEDYAKFVRASRIDHSVIVHPEPYQDDHTYLEYCFAHEPSPNFFKGTCLFDPTLAETAKRMEDLVKRNPGRIVALRIHKNHKPGTPPVTAGAIHDRDLRHPVVRQIWRKAGSLGLAIQMHFTPHHAPLVFELASEFRDIPVVLDHLARPGQGTAADYKEALKLARLPRVYMKYSGLNYASKQGYPYDDVKPVVRQIWDAFGPDRILWGVLGMNIEEFERQAAVLDRMFDYASESDRAKIRGLNAQKLYGFK